MTDIYSNGKEEYSKLQLERFVEKTVNVAAPIKKSSLYESQSKKSQKSKTASRTYTKEVPVSPKSFEIACSRGIPHARFLNITYLRQTYSWMKITQRNQGNTNSLDDMSFTKDSDLKTYLVVNFMSLMCQLALEKKK